MIRPATPGDVPALVELVYDLAEYERSREQCTLTPQDLHTALFGPSPAVFAHVATTGTPERVAVVATWAKTAGDGPNNAVCRSCGVSVHCSRDRSYSARS